MIKETPEQRSDRILGQLLSKYPNTNVFDIDGRKEHFVCELEPTKNHPEYDRAIEVIISSKPHKHLKTTQNYKILSGTLELHIGEEMMMLKIGDTYTMEPNNIHWAKSDNECWVEIYSKPGWTKEDHINMD
ncbi:MAG: hypothetical protein V1896_01295 [Candidatus Zambryskibacteria bacterium]